MRRALMATVIAGGLVLALAGCEVLGLATPDPAAALARQLAAGRETWSGQAIDDYTLTVRYGCFCPDTVTGPFVVTVVDGVPTEIRRADGAPIAGEVPSYVPRTIEGVFDAAARAMEGDDATIAFDEQWGFPREIGADPIENAVDDEWSIAVLDFVPAAP